jgi:NAD(P)H-flavin reductase
VPRSAGTSRPSRDARAESPTARTIVLDVPAWPGRRAGHHVDVRLTAEDGYQASRSYSIASAPEHDAVELTIERFEDGEVSPYTTELETLTPRERLHVAWTYTRYATDGWRGWTRRVEDAMLRAAGPPDDAAKAAARVFVCGAT